MEYSLLEINKWGLKAEKNHRGFKLRDNSVKYSKWKLIHGGCKIGEKLWIIKN